jgi:chromosomal replication initiator protein
VGELGCSGGIELVSGADVLWTTCAELLREQVSEAVWLTSFSAIEPIVLDDHRLVVAVPSSLVKERIESRYLPVVRGAMADAGAPEVALEILVRTDGAGDTDVTVIPPSPAADPDVWDTDTGAADVELAPSDDADAEDHASRYTFDAFVIGTSNRFAHAAALAVAETPARSYNPLFIYGGSGLGKTHLLQAIANYVGEHYPTFVVRYVSTEHFLNQYVDAIRANEMAAFKKRYREVDVLLLDDIQLIENKEGLQEELFHTFNTLYQANRQVVFSSDRSPDAIATLEDRLRSRFKSGLITEITSPELETRLAILRKKAESEPVTPPQELLYFIAENISTNIRELEGALIRVLAYASLTKEPLTVDMAERVLGDLIGDSQARPITPALILDKTSEMFGFPIDEIQGKSRRRPLVTARQISMYVFREMTDLSYPAIAREFGGRDHTTVIHAVEKVGTLMKERRQVYDQVTELTQRVRNGS